VVWQRQARVRVGAGSIQAACRTHTHCLLRSMSGCLVRGVLQVQADRSSFGLEGMCRLRADFGLAVS
jgi:hypothetical protein